MKTTALLFLLLSSYASAQTLPGALVWLPAENFRRWSEVDALMRARSGIKITIGVTPEMATPLVKAALMPWVEQGRLELAVRIDGDPVLPLITGHPAAPRPQDAIERAVDARVRLKKSLGLAPQGFVPGAGALDADLISAIGASDAGWILTGPYAESDGLWAAAGRTTLIPSNAAILFDESASTSSAFLAAAAERPRPAGGWATLGELARVKSEGPLDLAAIGDWPAWDAAAAQVPPLDPGARAAWDAYGAAAKSLDLYQNSGAANLRTLESAVALLRRAQAARFYRPTDAETLSPELRAALLLVYKKLKVSAPDDIYGKASAGQGASPAERPTGVQALAGAAWLEMRAPLGTIALAPASATSPASSTTIVDGGSAADPWRIRSLRVEWDNDAVRLILKVGRASNASPRPVYDIYTDINHVLGAGRVPMLEGRGAVVPARDAWELGVSITGDEARLYRASGGEPRETAQLAAQWRSDRGEVSVTIPRSHMRGTPSLWGWTVVAFAEDPSRPGQRPAVSLVAPDGTILLGALAPTDQQKPILSRANSRVPMSRLTR